MLTYETIREYVTREKQSQKLIELPDSFFQEARAYLENKEKVSSGKEDVWELENSRRMLQDLLDSRENKLVKLALIFVRAGVTPGKVMPEEKDFFDTLVKSIKSFQESRTDAIEGAREPMATMAVVEDIPKLIGVNMKEYGPFRKGEIARLPKENADLLVSKGLAKQVEGK